MQALLGIRPFSKKHKQTEGISEIPEHSPWRIGNPHSVHTMHHVRIAIGRVLLFLKKKKLLSIMPTGAVSSFYGRWQALFSLFTLRENSSTAYKKREQI